MAQIQEKAAQLFKGSHVTCFVYVDDKFNNTVAGREEVKDYVRENKETCGIVAHPEIWEDEFEDWWRNATDEEKQAFVVAHGIKAENADDLRQRFDQILPEGVSKNYLHPEEFDKLKDVLLGAVDANHQIMVLFDHRLEGYGRNGEQVLEQLCRRDYVNCALFSGTFTEEQELEKWGAYRDKAFVYLMSKSRISSDDEGSILEGIRNVLWIKQITKLKEYAKETLGRASTYMNTRLDDMDPSTFHKAILDRSSKEGCWEFETLLRIMYAYMSIGLKNEMQGHGYTQFQELTKELREIRQDASALRPNKKVLTEVSKEEIYEGDDYINKTFSQISNGDIFQIGQTNKAYMLLCQPCNLEIRSDGKRAYEFDQFFLVPIREYREEDKGKKQVERLKKVEGEAQLCVELANYRRISLSLLDLVSFRSDGKVIVDLNQTTDNHPQKHVIQHNMMMRYGEILEKIKDYKERYDMVQVAGWGSQEKQHFEKDVCRPFEMGDKVVAKHPLKVQGNPNVLDFQIQRIRRYKDPYAKDLLGLFMGYLSRPGYPMDLDVAE